MPRMYIHFELAGMAPKGSHKQKGMVTARAEMPTSEMNRCLLLDLDCIQLFFSQHICGLIRIYNVCHVKDEMAWDHLYNIVFLDPVTTRHFSQFQLMWLQCGRSSPPFQELWAAFRSFMGQMFDKTRDQMNNWRWDNPLAIGDQVDHSNPQTTSLGKVEHTGEHFAWYISDDFRAKIEPPSCPQYKLSDFLAVRPSNWDVILDENDDDENWADPGAPSGGRGSHGDGNDNDNGEGEEDKQGGEEGNGKGREKCWEGERDSD